MTSPRSFATLLSGVSEGCEMDTEAGGEDATEVLGVILGFKEVLLDLVFD